MRGARLTLDEEGNTRFGGQQLHRTTGCGLAGHFRRYNKTRMLTAVDGVPGEVLSLRYFNPIGGLAWWINTFASHRSLDDDAINTQIRIFDRYVLPISKLVDPMTRDFFGQSLICVVRKR